MPAIKAKADCTFSTSKVTRLKLPEMEVLLACPAIPDKNKLFVCPLLVICPLTVTFEISLLLAIATRPAQMDSPSAIKFTFSRLRFFMQPS